MKFSELGLDEKLLKSIEKMGFEEATPIQEQTIPLALKGMDVIGQAQTGTGKTASFGLPMLQKINTKKKVIQGLVIAPTRELAIQTQEELFKLSRDKRVRVNVVYGGSDIGRQIKQLKETPQILVGTPGRLLDHIKRKTVSLDHVETLVLDEADEMLNMGFLEDIENIISLTPTDRQTLLFSATMPAEIKNIGIKFMKNPEHIRIKAKEMTANLIDQYFVKCSETEKFDIMTRLFDIQSPELTIIFGRTKRRVDELSMGLETRGYKAAGIHGDLSQQKRMSVLNAFKQGKIDILVATDVAARGLDISGVTHVYNYDIPQDPESYVHRIGRTGRAGKEGMSVTFVTPQEMDYLRTIEQLTRKRMSPLRPPTNKEAFEGQLQVAINQVETLIEEMDMTPFEKAVNELVDKYSNRELAALLLKTMSRDLEEIPVNITPEKPLPTRKRSHKNSNRRESRRQYDYKKSDRNYSNRHKSKRNHHIKDSFKPKDEFKSFKIKRK